MSKRHPQSYTKILLLLLALQIFTEARGQDISVTIKMDEVRRAAHIEGEFGGGFRPESDRTVVFRKQVIGDRSLYERFTSLEFSTGDGEYLPAVPIRPGEYVVQPGYSKWNYSVDLKGRPNRAAAHASWMNEQNAVLMLDDLLPVFGGDRRQFKAAVTLGLPDGWRAFASDVKGENGRYETVNTEGAVIFAGKQLREVPVRTKTGNVVLLVNGEWHFADAEAADMAGEIYDAYTKILGPLPVRNSTIALLKFPAAESPGIWEAETRGTTVTILSSDMPFKTQSQQRLHEQLRHEIFHLWFPNAVNLTGDYAWFYEGFALYQSLKLGVALKRIRFADFLDTLSRAYTIDANSKPTRPFTESSNIDPTLLYARGMLVAFLTYLRMLGSSGGKSDSANALSELFARHKSPAGGIEASKAVSNIVGSDAMQRYILDAALIDWSGDVASAGFESVKTGRSFALRVSTKPNGRQKAILKRLGYN